MRRFRKAARWGLVQLAWCGCAPHTAPRVVATKVELNATPAPSVVASVPARATFESLAGECTDDGWCWENPLPRGDTSLRLWGSAPDDVWAAGDAGIVLHFDGARWTAWPGFPRESLRGIWGRDRNDVWIVGGSSTVRHWDGKAWSDRPCASGELLLAVGASDDGRVWVASTRGAVWTWNGTSWDERVHDPCRANGCSWPVYATAGGGQILSLPNGRVWDGKGLVAALPDPAGRTFGGNRASSIAFSRGSVRRWDGARWITLLEGAGRALWGSRDDDVWLVGDGGTIRRFDGVKWTVYDAVVHGDLSHVWGSGPDDVWASGSAGLLHWDGSRWTNHILSLADASLADVWGAGECSAWVAGAHGTVLHRTCTGWSPILSGVDVDLWAAAGSSDSDVWIAGDGGTLLHFDGRSLSRVAGPTTLAIYGLWASARDDVWAVGAAGTIAHWDGTAWLAVPSPVTDTLRRIDGTRHGRAFAAGDCGTLIEWDGTKWAQASIPPICSAAYDGGDTWTGVALGPRDEVWLSCRNDLAARFDGHEWKSETRAAGLANYFDVAVDRDGAWLVGQSGTVVRVTGERCTQSATGAASELRAVSVAPEGTAWAVGEHGTILVHRATPE